MINIRLFRPEDREKVSLLIRKTLIEENSKDYPQNVIDYMINEFTGSFIQKMAEERTFLVAEKNEEIVGTATLKNNYIGTVFIHPEFQSQGIGTQLMKKVEHLAKSRGLKNLTLDSSITGLGFYKRRGYEQKEDIQDENYGKTYRMEKRIK